MHYVTETKTQLNMCEGLWPGKW